MAPVTGIAVYSPPFPLPSGDKLIWGSLWEIFPDDAYWGVIHHPPPLSLIVSKHPSRYSFHNLQICWERLKYQNVFRKLWSKIPFFFFFNFKISLNTYERTANMSINLTRIKARNCDIRPVLPDVFFCWFFAGLVSFSGKWPGCQLTAFGTVTHPCY